LSCLTATKNRSEAHAGRRVGLAASLVNNLLEMIMFAYLFTRIGLWLERAEQRCHDEYLAGARDVAELERRMRSLENGC
jgi:hypothetical protein